MATVEAVQPVPMPKPNQNLNLAIRSKHSRRLTCTKKGNSRLDIENLAMTPMKTAPSVASEQDGPQCILKPSSYILDKMTSNKKATTDSTQVEQDMPVEHSLRKLMTRDVKQRDLLDFYEKLEVLGVGSMGSVTKVQKKTTEAEGFARRKLVAAKPYPVQYALKTILLDRVSDPVFIAELRNEIEVLKSCDHPNIVKAIETFEFNSQISIIMELCSGGDLYSREPYTEEQARRIIRNLTSAIAYMHRCGIVHRGKYVHCKRLRSLLSYCT